MAILPPQSQKWPADRAVLFVHGVGNPKPGDYNPLVEQFEALLGDDAKQFAIYFLYYDQINEWVVDKFQAGLAFSMVVRSIGSKLDPTELGNVAADFGGDVIWPVLLADPRLAVRAAMLQQLQQIVLDGKASNVQPRNQHVSIITHSLGCFHMYEALSHAAATPRTGLGPASAGVIFDNVIMMASPVQLIRTVGGDLGGAIPQPESIHTISKPVLDIPFEKGDEGQPVRCCRRFVSITGNLDPVGGFFFRKQLPWGYMDLEDQTAFIDEQKAGTINGSEELSLASILQAALQHDGPPQIAPNNPHDWGAYVARHAADIKGWLT